LGKNFKFATSTKVCFPLPWREGMKGRGSEFGTFYDFTRLLKFTREGRGRNWKSKYLIMTSKKR
jgi:hypothetical protein